MAHPISRSAFARPYRRYLADTASIVFPSCESGGGCAHHVQLTLRRMGQDFSDQAMTLATSDRLVHHATILEMNVESYRRKAALKQSAVRVIER
jgi:hypothetical protein